MIERDVALTDYAIFIQCMAFSFLLARRQAAYAVLFLMTGLAALTGGTVHGFFVAHDRGLASVLWVSTLLFIGGAAVASWIAAVQPWLNRRWLRAAIAVGVLEWLAFAAVVLWVDRSFAIAIYQHLPAAAALLVSYVVLYVRRRDARVAAGIGGLVLVFVAGALQQQAYSPVPTLLTFNAFYHVLQMVALLGIFITAVKLGRERWTDADSSSMA